VKVISMESTAYKIETESAKKWRENHDIMLFASKADSIDAALRNLEATFGPDVLAECLESYIKELNIELKRGA
jgi:hypothetical protein